jgi:hypothetical protein
VSRRTHSFQSSAGEDEIGEYRAPYAIRTESVVSP